MVLHCSSCIFMIKQVDMYSPWQEGVTLLNLVYLWLSRWICIVHGRMVLHCSSCMYRMKQMNMYNPWQDGVTLLSLIRVLAMS